MGLTNNSYDTFVAQGFSSLTECRASSPGAEFPGRDQWTSVFAKNIMLNVTIPSTLVALGMSIIRRAHAAIDHYEDGRDELDGFVTGDRKISQYFRSLIAFEISVAMTYQGHEFARKAFQESMSAALQFSPACLSLEISLARSFALTLST